MMKRPLQGKLQAPSVQMVRVQDAKRRLHLPFSQRLNPSGSEKIERAQPSATLFPRAGTRTGKSRRHGRTEG